MGREGRYWYLKTLSACNAIVHYMKQAVR